MTLNKEIVINYRRLFFSTLFLMIALFGGLINMIVISYNNNLMPVYGEFEGLYTEKHISINNLEEVKFKLLTDIIPVFKGRISFGDLLMIIGVFTFFYNFYLLSYKEGITHKKK